MNKAMSGLALLFCATASHAANTRKTMPPPAVKAAPAPSGLPLRDVVLFSSGVGYFGRSGAVAGGAQSDVELSFRAEQINDILKSLVVLDPQGKVQPVTYTTKDALGRRLRALGQSLDGSVSLGALLRQFQGARVRVATKSGAIYEGRIISVSVKTVPVPKDERVIEVEILNLMTANGLAAISLDSVAQLRLLDARLDAELRQSLELLAGGINDQQRTVQLHFGAGAPRSVRVGYLQETPVWKTTYRLVLDAQGAPYLQGWGIVENTTDEDWKNVRLSLISGRPISFIQDLYQPLYVPRPQVAPQVIGSPLPQTYGETLEESDRDEAKQAGAPAARKAAPPPASAGFAGPMGGGGGGFGGAFGGRALGEAGERRRESGLAADQLAGVAALAQGEARGELFEYAIAQPVTIARQQAAMVPIIGQNIEGERLSIYDANVGERALLGLRLKNTSGLHLAGGPITVFREGIYAGDAQMTNLQPNEERLISYAVDLDLVTDRKQPNYRRETVSFSIRSGLLQIRHREFQDVTYTLRNKGREDKTVLIQQPIQADFALVEPKEAAEKTAQQYRFKVPVPVGKTVEFKVTSMRPVMDTLALFDMNFDVLLSYARNGQISEKLRAALQDLAERRRKITDTQTQLARIEREIADIEQEQNRIRQNMDRLDHNSELYKQYVAKFTAQETRVNDLNEQRAKLRDAQTEAQQQLRDFVDKLTVD